MSPKISRAFVINIKLIEEYMKKHNLTKEEFAKLCRFTLEEVDLILKNSVRVPLYQLVRISKIMQVKFENVVLPSTE